MATLTEWHENQLGRAFRSGQSLSTAEKLQIYALSIGALL
jgi:hypothetical protein